jgi:hypothetical protein
MSATKFGKFGDNKKAAYLEALRGGNHRYTAARSVGVSAELIRLYRKAFPAFGDEEDEAEKEANGAVENALFQAAVGGNVTAQQVWLYNRCPERWKDQRNLNIRKGLEDMTDEELLAVAAAGRGGVGAPAGAAGANGNGRGAHPPGVSN